MSSVFPRPSVRAMHCQHCGRPLIVSPGQSASNSCSPVCQASARAARTSAAIDAAQRLLGRWAEAPLESRKPLAEISTTEIDDTTPAEPLPVKFDVPPKPVVDDFEPEAERPVPELRPTARWGVGLALSGLVATAFGGAALVWVRPRLELDAISLAALTAALAGQIALLSGIGVLIRSVREPSGDVQDTPNAPTASNRPSFVEDRPPAERLSA
ncbi:MAG: hypothetical protein KF777_02265 [Planctomycetaceae bacterium]|nr:hypothetical protein [Planctomycetaceae bacterium]